MHTDPHRADLIIALTSAGLLPADGAPWSEHQRWIVDAGMRLVSNGLQCESIVQIAELSWSLAEREVDTVIREVGQGTPPNEALERQAIRRQTITKLIAAVRYSEVSTAAKKFIHLDGPFQRYRGELLHTPSPLFMSQFGLGTVLDGLRHKARNTEEPQVAIFLGRMLIGLGKHLEASRWLTGASKTNEDAIALAHLAITHAFSGHPNDARSSIEHALRIANSSALVFAFAAVVRAVEAGQASSLSLSSQLASEALNFLSKSREQPVGHDVLEELEARLARGRISLLMPPGFGVHQAGVADLEAVLVLGQPPLEGVPSGIAELFRLHAHYFLGVNLADSARATSHLQEVIVLDPACAFAEQAYRRIGELEQTP